MAKPAQFDIQIKDGILFFPKNSVKLALWDYPTVITDGTVVGAQSVSLDGTTAVGLNLAYGRIRFQNIRPKDYTIIASGSGIQTQIFSDRYNVPLPSTSTGSDIVWTDNATDSIATKITAINQGVYPLTDRTSSSNFVLTKSDTPYQIVRPLSSGLYVILPTDADVGKTFTIKTKVNGIGIKYNNVVIDGIITNGWISYIFDGSVWESISVTP